MKPACDQVLAWREAYLDSELDARTALEVQQHLASCPSCAARFAAESRWQQGLTQALGQTPLDPALWRRAELELADADRPRPVTRTRDRTRHEPTGWRFWLWPSPHAHLGLAAVWIALLVVHTLDRDPVSPAARPGRTASAQVMVALRDQQRLADELLERPAIEPAPAGYPPQSRKPSSAGDEHVHKVLGGGGAGLERQGPNFTC